MPIGLIFYVVADKEFAVEASRLVAIAKDDHGNGTITLENHAEIHTDTPYQELIDNYTYRVAESLPERYRFDSGASRI